MDKPEATPESIQQAAELLISMIPPDQLAAMTSSQPAMVVNTAQPTQPAVSSRPSYTTAKDPANILISADGGSKQTPVTGSYEPDDQTFEVDPGEPTLELEKLSTDLAECLIYSIEEKEFKLLTPENVFIQQVLRNQTVLIQKISKLEKQVDFLVLRFSSTESSNPSKQYPKVSNERQANATLTFREDDEQNQTDTTPKKTKKPKTRPGKKRRTRKRSR